MLGEITTDEGYIITAFSTMYMDWGLRIVGPDGKEVLYNPCYLSNDSYGNKPNPAKYEDWDDAEAASLNGEDDAFVPWTQADWEEALRDQADDFLMGAGVEL